MKKQIGVGAVVISVALAFLFFGCASADPPIPVEERPETVPEEIPEPAPEPEPEPEPEPGRDPEVQPEPEPKREPPEVSEEVYDQTFAEVEATIGDLNRIIASRDFDAWRQYLTERYIRTYSDPRVLEQSSQSSVLVRNNIVLESLEDYFTFVVVPSRANARLDDLVFIREDTVEAIMIIGDRRYVLYLLKNVNDSWKIDTF